MMDLEHQDVKYLPGVGPKRAQLLADELQIRTLHDLLYTFPYKHIDRSRLYYIHELTADMPYVQVRGQIGADLGGGLCRRVDGVTVRRIAEADPAGDRRVDR